VISIGRDRYETWKRTGDPGWTIGGSHRSIRYSWFDGIIVRSRARAAAVIGARAKDDDDDDDDDDDGGGGGGSSCASGSCDGDDADAMRTGTKRDADGDGGGGEGRDDDDDERVGHRLGRARARAVLETGGERVDGEAVLRAR
jgi:hypothetical protein